MDEMANNEFLQWDDVLNKPVIEILNALVFKKSKSQWEMDRIKKRNPGISI